MCAYTVCCVSHIVRDFLSCSANQPTPVVFITLKVYAGNAIWVYPLSATSPVL